MKRSIRIVAAAAACSLLATMSACSSSSSSATSTASSGSSVSNSLSQFQALVNRVEAPLTPPSATPVTPPKGQKIGILSCGQAEADCRRETGYAQDAIKALGWSSVVADGQLSPQGWNTGLLTLVNDHVNGIIMFAVADSAVPEGLAAAAHAKIPVVNEGSGNSLAKPVANPSAANVDYPYAEMGQALASYIVVQSLGKAKVALLTDSLFPSLTQIADAEKATFAKCNGCSVVNTTEVGQPSNVIGAAAADTQALLARYPKGALNWIIPPVESFAPGVIEAITTAGRTDVHEVNAGCTQVSLPDIRQPDGIAKACIFTDEELGPWMAVDEMVRILAHETPENQIIPVRLITTATANQVLPNDELVSSSSYAAYYERLWGIS
jgi:ribose transport system substrate-binding protein